MAAEAAVSSAVQILSDLLIQKVNFLQGVEGEVQGLKDELKRMQCFLKDAAKKKANDERVRNWISETREIAQDAEDAIEMFVLKIENARSGGQLRKFFSFPSHMYNLYKVGEEIESIQKRLQDLDRSRERYGIQDHGQEVHSTTWISQEVERQRRLDPWGKDKDVVGLEEDVKRLLEEAILDGRKGLCIATIEGMGGIGKSTLARRIYNQASVAAEFERRAWVVVSNEFTPHETIKQLMLGLQLPEEDKKKIRQEIKELEESTKDKLFLLGKFKEMVNAELKGKQYFVVLDDVWESTHWETLESAFPNEDKGSRLLLTSRNRIIRRCAPFVHEMKRLDSEKSWELLLKKAFINTTDGKCPEYLKDIGEEILRKCGGLPLAISVVGGLLVEHKQSRTGWEKVLKGINSRLARGKNSVTAILELSYQNLPPQLKPCFLCLAFFQEDAPIEAKKLINIWIAQGLVLKEVGGEQETMEDRGSGYLDELINRNIVEIKEMTFDDQVITCHIHDLIRELSIEKASEEINFEILKEEGNSQSSDKPRHRAMYGSGKGFINSTNQNKRLRTLFIHGVGQDIDVPSSSSYWKSFELLRVLDFEGFGFEILPNTIGALIGLRYLGLRGTFIKKLPRSLRKLKNLEVIDLSRCFDLKLPKFLPWKMDSLRYVYYHEGLILPLEISTLKNLQRLRCRLSDLNTEQLKKMPSLCELDLEISGVSDVNKLFTTLAVLRNLVNLTLKECGSLNMSGLGTLHRLTHLTILGSTSRLPSDLPPKLSYLALVTTLLSEDPMPVLEKLPNLEYLILDIAYDGKEMVISHGGFPTLKRLSLVMLYNLRNIKVGEGGMPQLKQLCLTQGFGLLNIEVGQRGMPELKRFQIEDCNNLNLENLPEHIRAATITNFD